MTTYWHGGPPGRKVGSWLLPRTRTGAANARTDMQDLARSGAAVHPFATSVVAAQPGTDRVSVTSSRDTAVRYALLDGGGALYRVLPVGDLRRDVSFGAGDDAYHVDRARVLEVFNVQPRKAPASPPVAAGGDGAGWVTCRAGHRHWGRYGAAGILLRNRGMVLLQHRASWSDHGNTWGLPGGAIERGETALAAALRELQEETGIDPATIAPISEMADDHGRWSYTTVIADLHGPPTVTRSGEGRAVWARPDQIPDLPLHPDFAAAWPRLADAV